MMSSNEDSATLKIVDFGLSKIVGRNETACESFGSPGYVAPEVISAQPYSFSCDIWSIGCIFFAMVSGALPFDSDDVEELKRMTIEEPLMFTGEIWKTVSPSCKDLIYKLLIKKSAKRISLQEAIKHTFFCE